MARFRYINLYWIPRVQNSEANDLTQMASGYKDMADQANFPINLLNQGDWRADIFNYKMKWLIRHSGYYWPDTLEDCLKYYKGC
jgi:hypothetical protein